MPAPSNRTDTLQEKDTITLWTYQRLRVWNQLEKGIPVRTTWDRISPPEWLPAFRWMSAQMEANGICMRGFAPKWAWHSCGGIGLGPNQIVATGLLSSSWTGVSLTLQVPKDLVFLSRYGPWNDLLDLCYEDHFNRDLIRAVDQILANIRKRDDLRRTTWPVSADAQQRDNWFNGVLSHLHRELFQKPDKRRKKWDNPREDVQAALPFILRDWVVQMK